jgi:peptidoglycan/LPS O-acetylase OafA/YrhL
MFQHRREIDGLRAIALLPVILYHLGVSFFKGGFVGVDVFFVISGYLITSLIFIEKESGDFSILKFYERRIRRIFPSLFLVIIVSTFAAWFVLSPSDLIDFSKSIQTVPLLISNLYFWRRGGYFETSSELSPMFHTWSIAVEEQFYLLFPIFLIFCWRLRRKIIILSMVLAFTASLIVAELSSSSNRTGSYYLLTTRVWELLLGAFVGIYLLNKPQRKIDPFRTNILGLLGFGMITFSIFSFNQSINHPGLITLIPTLGTVLIILFVKTETYLGRILGNKFFVGIGLVSYSAYLWHQPIFAFYKYLNPNTNLFQIGLLIFLIFLLSFLSYKYVEKPFRNWNLINSRKVFSLAIFTSILIVLIGGYFSKLNFDIEERMASKLSLGHTVFSSNEDQAKLINARIRLESKNPNTLVLGSSRVLQIGNNLLGPEVLNLGIGSATLQDLKGIYSLVSTKLSPETIYIGVDPWIFNTNSGIRGWAEYGSILDSDLSEPKFKNKSVIKGESLNRMSFSDKFVNFYYKTNLNGNFVANDSLQTNRDKILPDGTRVAGSNAENKPMSEVQRTASQSIDTYMGNFEYSTSNESQFRNFIASLALHHKVVLVLVPYHPSAFDTIESNREFNLQIEDNIRVFAMTTELPVLGSYDSHAVGCDSSEFYDRIHPKVSCIEKVINLRS